jgi:hypothetical protein
MTLPKKGELRVRKSQMGSRLFRLLVKHLVENIPIYGPSLKFGIEAIEVVKEELEKESGEAVSTQEAASSIASLSHTVASREVDAALSSPSSRDALSTLSSVDTVALRANLTQAPSRLCAIMREIEAAEAAAQKATIIAQAAAVDQAVTGLRASIERHMERGDHRAAFKDLHALRKYGGWTRDHRQLERFLYKRLGAKDRRGLIVGSIAASSWAIFLVALDNNRVQEGIVTWIATSLSLCLLGACLTWLPVPLRRAVTVFMWLVFLFSGVVLILRLDPSY